MTQQTSFAARITRTPFAFDADRGAEARALFADQTGAVAELITGAGGCSPYLSGLMTRERDWLARALEGPEAALAAQARALTEMAEGDWTGDLSSALRQAKRRTALLTGLADLGGVWNLEEVTGALTDFAALAADLALKSAVATEIKRGKLPEAGEQDIAVAGGIAVLAMGKMGAGELNYSSDIDLICLFDEGRYGRDDYHEARASLIRATRKMAATLSEITAEGYVFRTDLRLRPDPSVTPVCMSMEAAERYYESLGRTWERAAYIKARSCAGDVAAGERFLNDISPFVWRRHLDFAAIQDAHDMRLAIREHKGTGGAITLLGHDMKLGRGGIREIEFFTQTRQLIAGGRDRGLRDRRTVPSLNALADKGWVPRDVAEALAAHYRWHREVEHRLQMVNDAQIHALPQTEEGMARIAAFMGRDLAGLKAELTERLSAVHEIAEQFFTQESMAGRALEMPAAPDALPSQAPERRAQPEFDPEVIARWRSYPALRSARAQEIFDELSPQILACLGRAARPAEALAAFDGFLAGLPAGVQLFSLFKANPQLIDLIADISGTAPELARYLSRNSSVFDAVIGGDFFAPWPGPEALEAQLGAVLDAERDYESKLDATRRWAKEWHFGIGVHLLRGLTDAAQAAEQYCELAASCLKVLFEHVAAQFAVKHGPPPGRGACVLAMGSLGAGRLNPASDLDVIVIYDPQEAEESLGTRPLPVRTYYARLTQALITAVSAQMAGGRLYEIDMRLRPSGTQGPVATSWQSFQNYQDSEAWTWEHLALTRARIVADSGGAAQGLGADIEAFRAALVARKGAAEEVLRELAQMRTRINAAKGGGGPWEVKIGAGRMQDIELFAQAALLMAGQAARDVQAGLAAAGQTGWITDEGAAQLTQSYALCWKLQVVSKLLTEGALDTDVIGRGGCALLLRETGQEDIAALRETLARLSAQAAAVIEAALQRPAAAIRQTGKEPARAPRGDMTS
ncbi:bifunctional [glutamine synthetase] adenylyltransferase/[glutamine synthetase]-adenylyl-L-tyrosine phosphorylase [Litorivita sp. NS0012-18]|uniref:bifunctional [glutamine synthetase] adenylyltransferase/[glutamine synthetase]-adenylyl-L-tyrosine phosphorylase n=1 Tax=Litorivita sp. NS0012-18 TaxID=3127655 RepID=UPI00310B86EF